jgi:ribokinase
MTRVAVVGHIEWVDFVPIDHFPRQGELLHAQSSFTRVGGGGGVAAAVLTELGAEVDFFLALGDDAHGTAAEAELRERGVAVHAARRDAPTRRAITLLEDGGERTIVTIGERLYPVGSDSLPWERLDDADGVYFTAGDEGALAHARRAGALVASPRGGAALEGARAQIDALVYSGEDPDEVAAAERIAARARLLVATAGPDGGTWRGDGGGRWDAVALDGPARDTYGAGDSFAACLTFGLAEGRTIAEAAQLGAECGARALTRVGAP